jgi:DMSO reductase iron-sulfur subunit
MQLGFSFNVSRCSGCMACIVACLDHQEPSGDSHPFRHVTRLEKGGYPSASISFISLACLHCGDAPCVMVCPTGALFKRDQDGIVDVKQDLCVGCHSCALVCPFGAPQFPEGGKMSKCNFCIDRVERNMEPACVRVCPTRAIGFGPMEKLSENKASKASKAILDSISTLPGSSMI